MYNTDRLRLFNLPVFNDIDDLASLCHISSEKLRAIFSRSSKFYRQITIPKKSGGTRKIYQPNKTVKAVQAWILRHILDKISPSHHATAFRKNISIKNNIEPHKFNRYFFCVDLKDFFPSIDQRRTEILFQRIGYSSAQAVILANLCTCNFLLPQGGVTSPAISNLVVSRLDTRLSGFCSKKHIIYTRYADDMTFSSNNRNILNNSTSIIKAIIEDEKFEINAEKVRFIGPGVNCKVTGLVKDSSEPKFGVGKKKKNWMRSVIFNFLVNKTVIDQKYKTFESILGWLGHVKFVDEPSFNYLNTYMSRLIKTCEPFSNGVL